MDSNKDIQFEILDEYGKNINCVIISSVPISENEINIMYKREDDEADTFRYGKIIKKESSYEIKKDITEEEIIELRDSFDNEVVKIANDLLEQKGEE